MSVAAWAARIITYSPPLVAPMPIPVECPSCSARFRVKDEVAGKRAKCPKCGEPLTIPTAFQAAETMLEPPSVKTDTASPKPQPPGDTGDGPRKPNRRRDDDEPADAPGPKRRSAADEGNSVRSKNRREEEEAGAKPRAKKRADDEDDEKPRSRKRREDDEDDRPKKTRRRDGDGDDKPKKKSNALVIILGIVGGLFVVCGGGCAGVWFGVIAPAAEKARKLNDEKQAELDRWEKEFGKPQPNPGPGPGPNPGPGPSPNPRPGTTPPTGTKPPTTYAKSSKPVAVLSPDEFARDFTKYIDQWVVVKGKLAKDLEEFDEWDALVLERGDGPKFQFGGIGSCVYQGGLKKGTQVEVWGFVANPMYFADKRHELRSPLLLSTPLNVSAAELLDDYRKTPKNKVAKYDGQTFRLTGTVRRFDSVKQVVFEEKMFDGTKYVVLVNFESGDDDNFKVGDTITALVRGRDLQDALEGKEVHLLNARFISKNK